MIWLCYVATASRVGMLYMACLVTYSVRLNFFSHTEGSRCSFSMYCSRNNANIVAPWSGRQTGRVIFHWQTKWELRHTNSQVNKVSLYYSCGLHGVGPLRTSCSNHADMCCQCKICFLNRRKRWSDHTAHLF